MDAEAATAALDARLAQLDQELSECKGGEGGFKGRIGGLARVEGRSGAF